MNKTKHQDQNIICLVYPNAYIYCDKTKYEDGDLMEVARILFEGYEEGIKYRKNSILEEKTINSIEKTYKQLVDDFEHYRGVEVSACGQRFQPTVRTVNGERI